MVERQQENLHIAIVSSILHPRYGGPSIVVDALYRHLSSTFHISIWGRNDRDEEHLLNLYPKGRFFRAGWPHKWFYCRGLYESLLRCQPPPDLIHAHMLWDYSTFAASRAAKKKRIPIVVTIHGSLNDLWRQKGFHKNLYRRIVLKRMLSDISCIHALNDKEKDSLLSYGVNCPIEIIPNGIDSRILSVLHNPISAETFYPALKHKRRILFMGRLCPEKGLDLLVAAWAGLRDFHKDWVLILAGPDYRGYESTLRDIISGAHLNKNILLTGMVQGVQKEALLSGSNVFVLPSRSEGFSMSILEALGFALPVVCTEECNFPQVAAVKAGIETQYGVDALGNTLRTVLGLTDSQRFQMGLRGRELVRRQYTWDKVAAAFVDLYHRFMAEHNP
jgi:glycosyltransferase involved in cell wall biosynthesis